MAKEKIPAGVAHALPTDLRDILTAIPKMRVAWEDITPLARNEWICWVESAKKPKTRSRRLRITRENLTAGKRRPCCWAGCAHRRKDKHTKTDA